MDRELPAQIWSQRSLRSSSVVGAAKVQGRPLVPHLPAEPVQERVIGFLLCGHGSREGDSKRNQERERDEDK